MKLAVFNKMPICNRHCRRVASGKLLLWPLSIEIRSPENIAKPSFAVE